MDVLTSRVDRFGEDKSYSHRILLLYDGIHYDALAKEQPDLGTLQTIFPLALDSVSIQCVSLLIYVRFTRIFLIKHCVFADNLIISCALR